MLLFALLFSAVNVFSQSAGNSTSGSQVAVETPTDRNNVSKQSLFYGDNIIAHFKEFTGDDLFTNYPDFPRYKDTGNLHDDVLGYKKRVYDWIKINFDFAKKYRISLNDLHD